MTPLDKLAARFWSHVQKTDGCWEWIGFRNEAGYGRLYALGRFRLAPRVVWFLETGEWPTGRLLVCHKCDNPSCVRFDHRGFSRHRESGGAVVRQRVRPLAWPLH